MMGIVIVITCLESWEEEFTYLNSCPDAVKKTATPPVADRVDAVGRNHIKVCLRWVTDKSVVQLCKQQGLFFGF